MDNLTIKKWVELWVKYPLDMLGVYTRHIISSMTPNWNYFYIYSMKINALFTVVVSIVLWLLVGLDFFMMKPAEYKTRWVQIGYIVAALVPALLQSLGAVEVRFFLPAYIVCYGYAAYGIDYKILYKKVKPEWLKVFAVLLLIFALWISCFADILANNAERVILINNSGF